MVFGIIPECRSASFRKQRSASPESPLFLAHRLFEDLEIEVPHGHPRSNGYGLPVEVVLQDGSLPTRRPGATPVGTLTQPAFVDEDDRAPFRLRLFFYAGPSLAFPVVDGLFAALQ